MNGRNTSSTSLSVQWGPIPSEHQNGIIIQYHIWYRQNQSENTDWFNTSVNSAKTSVNISGLIKFTFYEIKVAGATSVGIGNQGNPILVQTDADGKAYFILLKEL